MAKPTQQQPPPQTNPKPERPANRPLREGGGHPPTRPINRVIEKVTKP